MHIGVDLDNTILDATSAHLKYYNAASGFSFTPKDVNDFYIYRLYGWDKATRDAVYTKHGREIHWNSLPYPMAQEILQELANQHRVSIITARPLLFRNITLEWLKHYNIAYDNITFTENKLQECLISKVDLLIDDGPHYAEEFALANKPVILYEQPYNLSVTNELVYRASNWMEVKRHIDDLETKIV
ncbi:hypothetical protein AB6A23_21035 [Paenibacillus tarimensis]